MRFRSRRTMRGSERGGRIVLADVRAYIQRLQAGTGEVKKPAAERIDFAQFGPVLKKPMSSLRLITAAVKTTRAGL